MVREDLVNGAVSILVLAPIAASNTNRRFHVIINDNAWLFYAYDV